MLKHVQKLCETQTLVIISLKDLVYFFLLQGAAFACEDEDMKAQTLHLGHNLAGQYQNLLQQLMISLSSGTVESKSELMNISRMIAQTATSMAQVAEKLKGSDWVDPEDPMLIAENELLSAAEAIEQAAKNLATLRPKSEIPGQVQLFSLGKIPKHL